MKPTNNVIRNRDGSMIVTFILPGDPIGKPRQTQSDRWKRRACVVRYRQWADALRAAAVAGLKGGLPEEWPVKVDILATFGHPGSWSAARKAQASRAPHHSKPDVDNIAKAVLDALIENDEGVSWLTIRKLWGAAGEEGATQVTLFYDASEQKVAP
jgi:Holliday junction resolvase RusA-like endonuclease